MRRRIFALLLAAAFLASAVGAGSRVNLIIDTDLFSDVDDAGALLLATTLPNVNLLAVNVDYGSAYSALAVSAILSYYGHPDVLVGLRRPFTNAFSDTFFDSFYYKLGEYASKVAYHWSNDTIQWDKVNKTWDPVHLYRKTLAEQPDGSVTIASIGFFENLSGLLNSTADHYSSLSGPELIAAKVTSLVVMGGEYPSGSEYNFYGDNPVATAHVINGWQGRITYCGFELGLEITSGARLSVEAPAEDPVAAAYRWYAGYNTSTFSWDPLTVLYACQGLGSLFQYANVFGYNYVYPNGSNTWIYDETRTDQHWLKLKVSNLTAGEELDRLYLEGSQHGPSGNSWAHTEL